MNRSSQYSADEKKIWDILAAIPDPEIPVLTILDLGIVRDINFSSLSHKKDPEVEVVITPTYSGCPAMDIIAATIRLTLLEKGYPYVKIKSVLSPAWTTDWISEEGKEKLKKYGIAPPVMRGEKQQVACSLCQSLNTRLVSAFGSTPCKALYQCNDCQEPFDYFKCH